MATPTTRKEFIDYCKRRLGHPVIEINVDDDQVDDRIDDALEFWSDYHFDGTEKLYLKHIITQADHDRRYLIIPERIIGVTGIMDLDGSASSVNMFDLRYQLRLHDLYDFTSVSYVPYTITMQHLRTMQLLFSGTPQTRFQRHKNRLMLDINWEQDGLVGTYVIIECYGTINPERITIPGTFSVGVGSSEVIGTAVDGQVNKDDEIIITTSTGDVSTIVTKVNSNVSFNVAYSFANTETGLSAFTPGNSDVWNDRVLKNLGTAYIKRQWGENLKKFGNIMMPGGVVLNGQIIFDEATAEIKEMKDEFVSWNTLQSDFLVG
jgi:hypothetical protein